MCEFCLHSVMGNDDSSTTEGHFFCADFDFGSCVFSAFLPMFFS